MAEVKIIHNDYEVLEYSELFGIRHRLKQYLKDKVECTFIRQIDRGDGKISVSVISVHTLKGDEGFTCLVFPDKSKSIKDIKKFLEFRANTTGIKRIVDEGSLDDDIIGVT